MTMRPSGRTSGPSGWPSPLASVSMSNLMRFLSVRVVRDVGTTRWDSHPDRGGRSTERRTLDEPSTGPAQPSLKLTVCDARPVPGHVVDALPKAQFRYTDPYCFGVLNLFLSVFRPRRGTLRGLCLGSGEKLAGRDPRVPRPTAFGHEAPLVHRLAPSSQRRDEPRERRSRHGRDLGR